MIQSGITIDCWDDSTVSQSIAKVQKVSQLHSFEPNPCASKRQAGEGRKLACERSRLCLASLLEFLRQAASINGQP